MNQSRAADGVGLQSDASPDKPSSQTQPSTPASPPGSRHVPQPESRAGSQPVTPDWQPVSAQPQSQPHPPSPIPSPAAGGDSGYDTDDFLRQLQPAQEKRSRRGGRAWFGLPPSKAEQREMAQLDAVRSQFARPV